MAADWTSEELKASVETYIEMRSKEKNNEPFIKKHYYERLAGTFNRSPKSFEWRMQNISHVYQLMGRDWISGLRPAKNVGIIMAQKIENLINESESHQTSNSIDFQFAVEKHFQENIAFPSGVLKPQKNSVVVSRFIRSAEVTAWVLKNSNGLCESCNDESPFYKEDGSPFLEVHHLRRLTDGGSDTIANAIAICPNCHREFHYGGNKKQKVKNAYEKISRLVKE